MSYHKLAIAVVALLGAAAAAVLVLTPAPVEEYASHATHEPGFWIEYTMYSIGPDGRESVFDTNDRAVAEQANATGRYAMKADAKYRPTLVLERNLTADPIRFIERALARGGVRHLEPGQAFDFQAQDLAGTESELVEGSVQRIRGPYPATYDVTVDAYRSANGADPHVGDVVNATPPFTATVTGVDGERVHLKVNVRHGQSVLARPLAAAFEIQLNEDESEFRLVLNPIERRQFRLAAPNDHLGLPAGNFLWRGVTETSAQYLSHPTTSPVYLGIDFHVVGRAVEPPAAPSPPGAETDYADHE